MWVIFGGSGEYLVLWNSREFPENVNVFRILKYIAGPTEEVCLATVTNVIQR